MQLPTPLPDPTNWGARVGAQAAAEFNCTASFYSSEKNVGSAPTLTLLFAATPARVALLSTSETTAPTSGAYVEIRDYRVQIPLDAYADLIPTGTTVRIAGGDDPVLAGLALKVKSAVNGARAAVRTVECRVEIVTVPAVSD